jgi:hypothetical protein
LPGLIRSSFGLLSLVAMVAVPGRAWALSCGDTVSVDTALTVDLVCPPSFTGAVLTIGADGVDLSGNGFAIIAANASAVVSVTGRSDVSVTGIDASATSGVGVGVLASNAPGLLLSANDLSGRRVGIQVTGGSDVVITENDLRGSREIGLRLAGVDAGLILTENDASSSREGLSISGLVGPWALDPSNVFVDVGDTIDDDVVALLDVQDVSVVGLDLSANPAAVLLRVDDSQGVVVDGNDLSGGGRGLYTTGTTNIDLVVRDNDVSGSTVTGMLLDGIAPDLVLTGNAFDGSANGLRVHDLAGPWTLPASNSFVGVASASGGVAVQLVRTRDVTVRDLVLTGVGSGYGLRLQDTTRTVVEGVVARRRSPGIGVDSGVNTDVTVRDNDLGASGGFGLRLVDVGPDVVVEGNDFTGSFQGVELFRVDGVALDPSNIFANVAVGGTGLRFVVRVRESDGVVLDGLDLSSTTGTGYAIRATNTDGLVVRNNDLSGRRRGFFGDGVNTAATIRENDASNSAEWAIYAQGMDADFVLRGNIYDGSRNGLRLNDLQGPLTINMGSSSAVDLGDVVFNSVVWGEDLVDVDFVGLRMFNRYDMYGWSLRNATNVTVSETVVCGMDRGIDLRDETSVTVEQSCIGSGNNGVYLHITPTSTVTVDAELLGISDPLDHASGEGTVSVNFGVMADDDGDGTGDLCDPCPNDPLVGHGDAGPCVNVDLCVGDDLSGDVDGDGWCADLDCDDTRATVYPGAAEVCDGLDNDCLFGVDDGAQFLDGDGDGCADCENGPLDEANDGDDNDADGACDYGDEDDDDDGVDDVDDLDPFDPTRCEDQDGDGCDDCGVAGAPDPANDGPDSDGDGVCDTGEADFVSGTLLDTAAVAWTPGGIGAPSVIYDRVAGHYLMVYETRTARSDGRKCKGGTWALGLATSPDGLSWTDAGAPLLSPVDGSYYECVAAHPSLVQHSGQTVLFFKAEQGYDCDPLAPPSWGCDPFTGVGRMALSWNGSGYTVAGPDATPALKVGQNFGYPRAVYDTAFGQYRLAYTAKPDVFVARGTASRLRPDPGPVLSPPLGAWAPDELFNAAPLCLLDGEVSLFVGGRDVNAGGVEVSQAMGVQESPNWADWTAGVAPLFSTLLGDASMRHWDVLRLGTDDALIYFDDLGGPGGTNRVRVAATTSAWSVADVRDKTCF